jgi:hypothetical protein
MIPRTFDLCLWPGYSELNRLPGQDYGSSMRKVAI